MEKTGFKTAVIEKSRVDESQRLVTGWASTSEVDECGDVMVPQGVDTAYLDRHKSINIGHSRNPKDAIGSHRWVKKYPDRGVMVQFKMGSNPAGEEAWTMVQEQVLSCLSIEFEGVDFGQPTGAELKKWGNDALCVYRTWKMRGYALVSQPMNAGAVITEIKSRPVHEWLDRRVRTGKVTVDLAKRLGWEAEGAAPRLVVLSNGWTMAVPS